MSTTTGFYWLLVPLLLSCSGDRARAGACRAAVGHWQLLLTRDTPASAETKSEQDSFVVSATGELLDDRGQRFDQRGAYGHVAFRDEGGLCRVTINMPELGKRSEPYLPPTYRVLVGADGRVGGIGDRVHFLRETFTVAGRVHAPKQ